MPVTVRPTRAEELQDVQKLIVGSINDLTERHGFGLMACSSCKLPAFLSPGRSPWPLGRGRRRRNRRGSLQLGL